MIFCFKFLKRFKISERDWVLLCMPSESLLVEVDDKLRTFLASELRWNEHCPSAVLPLDQERKLPVDVRRSDDLLRLQAVVERRRLRLFRNFRVFRIFCIFDFLLVLLIWMFWLIVGFFSFWNVFLLWFLLILLLVLRRLGISFTFLAALFLLRCFVVLLGTNVRSFIRTWAYSTLLFSRTWLWFLGLKFR